jgi:hypothetical protein
MVNAAVRVEQQAVKASVVMMSAGLLCGQVSVGGKGCSSTPAAPVMWASLSAGAGRDCCAGITAVVLSAWLGFAYLKSDGEAEGAFNGNINNCTVGSARTVGFFVIWLPSSM